MDYFFHVAYPFVVYAAVPCIAGIAWWRLARYKPVTYKFPLTQSLIRKHLDAVSRIPLVLWLLRLALLAVLVIIVARPQLMDRKSNVQVDGVPIVLVLDVSGSMQFSDDEHDRRSRIDAAKQAAIQFVEHREHDPIGVVLFAKECVTRCPLTLDKQILKSILYETNLGVIDADGTLLCTGIAMGINRLKNVAAKSKILIVLTDGTPSEGDLSPQDAVALAKKFGIKMYTIGVGSSEVKYIQMGFQMMPLPPVNKELLHYLAAETGGKFFEAKKPRELQKIYQEIDRLEKTTVDTTIFNTYYELFMPFLIGACILAVIELLITSFVWFII